MIAHIFSIPTPLGSGWQVYVELEISSEEHVIIYENRMALTGDGNLEIAQYDGRSLHFGDFYGRVTVWDFNSSYQASKFIEQLNRTLNGSV